MSSSPLQFFQKSYVADRELDRKFSLQPETPKPLPEDPRTLSFPPMIGSCIYFLFVFETESLYI